MTRIRRIALACVVPLTLILAGCGGSGEPEPERAADSGTPTADQAADQGSAQATAAADWLAGQLENGLLSYKTEYGPFTDYGMSIDAALALTRTGGHEAEVGAIVDAVARDLHSYIEFPSGDGTHKSAGATAKALVLAEVAGEDPASFGGTDLVSALEDLVLDSGRISDTFPAKNKQDADYANVIGQVFAARGLAEAGSAEAGEAQDYLLAQQCEEGWFRLTFTAATDAGDQSCDADKTAKPDPDTTALAVIQLSALEDPDAEAQAAIDEAARWLAEQQGQDGSVAGAQSPDPNANTTGLAGWALGEAGDAEAAASAADWLSRLQAENGAVAYDRAALDQADGGEVPAKARSQWLLATAQSAPALLWYSA